MTLTRPGADEFAPYYATYIDQVTEPDVIAALATLRQTTASWLGGLSESQAGYRYAPGKWTLREVVGHVVDAERIFSYRLLRIARGDETPLASFDENAYVPAGQFERRPLADVAAELGAVRDATLALVRSVPADAWSRRGTASGKPISARALAYIIAGHERHHLSVLRERYVK
jgi:uncharacterized damage-inducible protein DinB